VNSVYIILGGNLGDKSKNLGIARLIINLEIGKIVRQSDVYETEPWGFENPDNFLNQVIEIKTSLNPLDLMKKIKKIETRFGRSTNQPSPYQSRQMDIDILFFNDEIIELPELVIPHPRLHERNFVLVPLTELEASLVHPVFNKTIRQLKAICKDKKWVKPFGR